MPETRFLLSRGGKKHAGELRTKGRFEPYHLSLCGLELDQVSTFDPASVDCKVCLRRLKEEKAIQERLAS
jgi:hypothetical protein